LENAVAYSPEGAVIRVLISAVDEGTALPPNTPPDLMLPGVLVEVRDSGPGIPEHDAVAVFEPFYRGRYAQANQVPGTGLGLTLAQSMIDLHRGKIWVEPTPDAQSGGRVCFVLPAAR
jgi:signal transduction histidine kinase